MAVRKYPVSLWEKSLYADRVLSSDVIWESCCRLIRSTYWFWFVPQEADKECRYGRLVGSGWFCRRVRRKVHQ